MSTLFLLVAGVAASAVSAATGMAGGVMMLAALGLVMPVEAVVPMHGAVQLGAGGTRTVLFRKDRDRRFIRDYLIGLVPGSLAGAGLFALVSAFDPRWLRLALGVMILVSLLPRRGSAPRPQGAVETAAGRGMRMGSGAWSVGLIGFFAGSLGMVVGSTGPLISRALLARGLVKEAHVATKAWVQSASHLVKIVLFGAALGFGYRDHVELLALLGGAVVAGTLLGRRAARMMSPEHFVIASRLLLGFAGGQMVIGTVWDLGKTFMVP